MNECMHECTQCICRTQHLNFLLFKKKLLLVLDLDHTLLSSTHMADLPDDILPKLEQLLEQQGTGEEQLLFKLPHMLMWTKLRPGIRDFLVQTHKLFELHIYTHGDQDYAAEMAKLLDPDKTFFGGRVISAVSMGDFKALAACLIATHYNFMSELILTQLAQLCPLYWKAHI